MSLNTLSINNPSLALRRLRLEQSLRSAWRCRDGSLVPIREMSDEHLENTIEMLEKICHDASIVWENVVDEEGGAK